MMPEVSALSLFSPITYPCEGLVVGTVIEGELTMIIGGTEQAYKVGEVFTEPPSVVAVAHNRGAVWSRVLGSRVIPRGAAPPSIHPYYLLPLVCNKLI